MPPCMTDDICQPSKAEILLAGWFNRSAYNACNACYLRFVPARRDGRFFMPCVRL